MDDLWVVLPHLGAGGAQKVALLAAEHFAAQGLRVRVITMIHGHPVLHALPDGVRHQELSPQLEVLKPWLGDGSNRSLLARGSRYLIANLIKVYRFMIRAQMVLIGPWLESHIRPGSSGLAAELFQLGTTTLLGDRLLQFRNLVEQEQPRRILALLTRTNIVCCLACWDLPVHVVVSERNDPARQRLGTFWALLRRLCYRRADVVTANTDGVLKALSRIGTWQRLELLPNPLPFGVISSAENGSERDLEVLAVARLKIQKGLDLLIRAFASIPEVRRLGWCLTVVGDGPERSSLENLVTKLGIDGVFFEGFRSDPQTFMQRAAIFALPSRFEGMPNALLEAMAAGLPCVVSDASPGPLEMITDGVNGLVVPHEDWPALAKKLEMLMEDQILRFRLGEAARQKLRSLDWSVVEPHWRSVLALPKL
ncbi:glycosyltransferase [Synechococcus sp. CC9311]|uniref:glycosyltransferase n=1 Tax=Synechococcus sp. (strain CC9311) TaxID=64471 RepID=UPI0000DDA9EF|nr:glycosyltransferase [Synechococcus sp. CC9311]ABI45426.1 glycosyl transferase, group 1 family protein [Synechococcus sp. CC9311]